MDNRFLRLFDMTEEEAIALLDRPLDLLGDDECRYVAASHLVNYPSETSIQALLRAVRNTDESLDNRITRRKAVESLGRLKAMEALPDIRACLQDSDAFLVENAAWAISEMAVQDEDILAEIAALLDKRGQSYRVLIQTLMKANFTSAVDRIRPFIQSDQEVVAGAAISAISRLTGESTHMDRVLALLQAPNPMTRRLTIQDLIDARYYPAIASISRCPVSLIFRLRGIRLLAEAGMETGDITAAEILPYIDNCLRDHPETLDLFHTYSQPPTLATLIEALYDTDFGRCYLAVQTILEKFAPKAPEALLTTFEEKAKEDYGGHFHVVKLLGWLKYQPAYDLIVIALNNPQPQFQKSRAAAAIALGELGDNRGIPLLEQCLESKVWDLRYAALMALKSLNSTTDLSSLSDDRDWLVRAKVESLLMAPTHEERHK